MKPYHNPSSHTFWNWPSLWDSNEMLWLHFPSLFRGMPWDWELRARRISRVALSPCPSGMDHPSGQTRLNQVRSQIEMRNFDKRHTTSKGLWIIRGERKDSVPKYAVLFKWTAFPQGQFFVAVLFLKNKPFLDCFRNQFFPENLFSLQYYYTTDILPLSLDYDYGPSFPYIFPNTILLLKQVKKLSPCNYKGCLYYCHREPINVVAFVLPLKNMGWQTWAIFNLVLCCYMATTKPMLSVSQQRSKQSKKKRRKMLETFKWQQCNIKATKGCPSPVCCKSIRTWP